MPLLFVYSLQDSACDFRFVEATVQRLRRARVDVQSLRLEDSAHLSHLQAYAEDYELRLKDFRAYFSPFGADDWSSMDRVLLRKAASRVAHSQPSHDQSQARAGDHIGWG